MNEIWPVIARLKRAQPRNPDTMAVCEALESLLVAAATPPSPPPFKPEDVFSRVTQAEWDAARPARAPGQLKPWEAAGMSRRTWYRRRREAKA